MNRTTLRITTGALAVLAPLAAAWLTALPWVPSWKSRMVLASILLALAGLAGAIAQLRATLRPEPERRPGYVAHVLGGMLLVAAAGFVALAGQVQLFPVRFVRAIPYATGTAYVYDASWKESAVEIRVGRGAWPLTDELLPARPCVPRDVTLEPDGRTLRVCQQRCDLRTLRCDR
jgi:hypothetical protein